MRVTVGVKNIGNGKLAHRDSEIILGAVESQLVCSGFDHTARAAQIKHLAQKQFRETHIRCVFANLVSAAVRKAGYPEGIVKTEALINFSVQPDFSAMPQTMPGHERDIRSFYHGATRVQALRAAVGRGEVRMFLCDIGNLSVQRPVVTVRHGQIGSTGQLNGQQHTGQQRHIQNSFY